MRKNKFNILIVILLLSTTILMGCGGKPVVDSSKEEFEYQAVPVKIEEVISNEVYQSIYTIGQIKSSEQYQVNAMINGDVLEVFYSVGDYVEEGEVLFTIDTSDFAVDKSTKLTQSLNAVTQAKIGYDSAKDNYEKIKSLFSSGVSSQAELDNTENQYNNARISYNNALKSYESVEHSYESMGDNYEVTSPASGVVVSANVTEGMFATSQSGYTIDVVDKYKVASQITSKYINDIEVGQEVEIYINTLDLIINGRIDSVSLSANNGSYPIEIMLDESNSIIKPGMYADVWVIKNKSSDGLWIPSQAILQENGESFVYTVEDGQAKKIIVDILSVRGENSAVKSILSNESVVITFGKEYVMDGAPVEVK